MVEFDSGGSEDNKLSFGKTLRMLRQDKDWTQVDLCQKLGLNHATIAKLESGLRVPGSEDFFNHLRKRQIFSEEEIGRLRSSLPEEFPGNLGGMKSPSLFNDELNIYPGMPSLLGTTIGEQIETVEAIENFIQDELNRFSRPDE